MSGVQVEATLDEDFFHERIANLDAGQFLAARPGPLVTAEGIRCKHRYPADTVQSGAGTEQDDLVAGTGGESQVQILLAQHTHTHRIDQRITGIGGVEHGFAADIGQTE